MRVVQVLVPKDETETVKAVLDEESVDYIVFSGALGGTERAAIEFPLPAQAVEYILEELTDAGIDSNHVVVVSAESARTENFHELEERFVAGDDEDSSIARDDIRTTAQGMQPDARTYYAMTLLSALVAVVGLLLDSAALVVGSMVIAPQVGSAMLTGVGLVISDRRMFTTGLRSQAGALTAAVIGATVFGVLIRSADFVPTTLSLTTVAQISQRISPGLLSFVVAVAAGAAAAFGLATALPVSLVGVMIAAALIPAAAAVGIGLAWGYPGVATGAFVLLVVNAVSINIATVVVLWYLGYRPEEWTDGFDHETVLTNVRTHASAVLTVLLLVGVLVVAGSTISQQVYVENRANSAVESVLDAPEYEDLTLLGVQVEFVGLPTSQSSPEITVVIGRPADVAYPDLSRRISEKVTQETGQSLPVTVEYRDRDRYEPPGTTASAVRAPRAAPTV